jgi:hypothetical protein
MPGMNQPRHIWIDLTATLHRFFSARHLSSDASAGLHNRTRSTYKRACGLRSTLRPCHVQIR